MVAPGSRKRGRCVQAGTVGGALEEAAKRQRHEAAAQAVEEVDIFMDDEDDIFGGAEAVVPAAPVRAVGSSLHVNAAPAAVEAAAPAPPAPVEESKKKKPVRARPVAPGGGEGVKAVLYNVPSMLQEEAKALQSCAGPTGVLRELPDDAVFLSVLEKAFGYKHFRDGQLETVKRIVRGESAIAILPTGAGKSLCYQFSIMIRRLAAPMHASFCLVISPLLSLMADQLSGLPKLIPGAQVTSEATLRLGVRLEAGQLQVLFLSPERAADSQTFHAFLAPFAEQVAFTCIDEAHCLSEWSHNFRPSYLRLKMSLLDRWGLSPVLCLTGTSTLETTEALQLSLGISASQITRVSTPRRNLKLQCVMFESESKDSHDREMQWLHLVRMTLTTPPYNTGSVVVYVNTQVQAELVATFLLSNGVDALSYHAGVDQRASRQTRFLKGATRVIVATVAFGMGIDKADVRGVVHLRLPPTLESYVQETGRAGRDGATSHCLAIVRAEDYYAARNGIYRDVLPPPVVRMVLERIFMVGRWAAPEAAMYPYTNLLNLEAVALAAECEAEVIETIITHVLLKHSDFVAPLGSHFAVAWVTPAAGAEDDAKRGGAENNLQQIGDSFLEGEDPVAQYITRVYVRQMNPNGVVSKPGRGRARHARVTVDLLKASRDLDLPLAAVTERIEQLKKRNWRVVWREQSMAYTLARAFTPADVDAVQQAMHAAFHRIRDGAADKVTVCYGWLRALAKNAFPPPEATEAPQTEARSPGKAPCGTPAPPMEVAVEERAAAAGHEDAVVELELDDDGHCGAGTGVPSVEAPEEDAMVELELVDSDDERDDEAGTPPVEVPAGAPPALPIAKEDAVVELELVDSADERDAEAGAPPAAIPTAAPHAPAAVEGDTAVELELDDSGAVHAGGAVQDPQAAAAGWLDEDAAIADALDWDEEAMQDEGPETVQQPPRVEHPEGAPSERAAPAPAPPPPAAAKPTQTRTIFSPPAAKKDEAAPEVKVDEAVQATAHHHLALYSLQRHHADDAVFRKYLAAELPAAATAREHAYTAIAQCVRADPIAHRDAIRVAKICQGILQGKNALHGHRLWRKFADQPFDWLARVAKDIISEGSGS